MRQFLQTPTPRKHKPCSWIDWMPAVQVSRLVFVRMDTADIVAVDKLDHHICKVHHHWEHKSILSAHLTDQTEPTLQHHVSSLQQGRTSLQAIHLGLQLTGILSISKLWKEKNGWLQFEMEHHKMEGARFWDTRYLATRSWKTRTNGKNHEFVYYYWCLQRSGTSSLHWHHLPMRS